MVKKVIEIFSTTLIGGTPMAPCRKCQAYELNFYNKAYGLVSMGFIFKLNLHENNKTHSRKQKGECNNADRRAPLYKRQRGQVPSDDGKSHRERHKIFQ